MPTPSPAPTNGLPVPTGSGSATLFIERGLLFSYPRMRILLSIYLFIALEYQERM